MFPDSIKCTTQTKLGKAFKPPCDGTFETKTLTSEAFFISNPDTDSDASSFTVNAIDGYLDSGDIPAAKFQAKTRGGRHHR